MSSSAVTLKLSKSEYLINSDKLDDLVSEFFGSLLVAAGHEDDEDWVIAFDGEHLGYDPTKQIHTRMDPASNRAACTVALASFRSTNP